MAFQNIDDEESNGQFEEFREVEMTPEESPQEEPAPGGKSPFGLILGIVGGVILVGLLAFALYYFLLRPQMTAQREAKALQVNATNTAIALNATQTELAVIQQQTLAALPTATKAPTNTPVVAPTSTLRPSSTPVLLPVAQTQTVVAFQTQAAATLTASAPGIPTSTALPQGGFAEDVGLPGMLAMAALLIVIIILARRLRFSSTPR